MAADDDVPPAVATLSAELSGLTLLEKTTDSAIDKRINESLKRLTKQLDKAKEHQSEGKRLFREVQDIEERSAILQQENEGLILSKYLTENDEKRKSDDSEDKKECEQEEPAVPVQREIFKQEEPNEEVPLPAVEDDATKSESVPEGDPTPEADTDSATPKIARRASVTVRSPTEADIVDFTQDLKKPKRPSSVDSRRRSSSGSRYSNVMPRYMQPLKPTSFLRSTEKPLDPVLSQHTKMISSNGYAKVQPRLYDERKEIKKKPNEPRPKKPKDRELMEHKILKSKLGYNRVKSRLFENTYGLSDVGSNPMPAPIVRRSSTPVHRGRSPSLSRVATPRRSSTPVPVVPIGFVPTQVANKSPLKYRAKRLKGCTQAARTAAEGSACWEEVESLLKLASANEVDGDYEAAEKLHLEVLRIRRTVLGGDHITVANSFTGLAMLCEVGKRWTACEMYCREAIQAVERLCPDKVKTIKLKLRQGMCIAQMAKYEEGETFLREILNEIQAMYPTDHTTTCTARHWLAHCINAQSRESEAAELQKLNLVLGFAEPGVARKGSAVRSGSVQSIGNITPVKSRRLSV